MLRHTQHIVKKVRVRPALILNVVNGENALAAGENRAIIGLQVHGKSGCLPIVALDDLGTKIYGVHGVQHGLREIAEAFAVVHGAVQAAPAMAEVIIVVNEINCDGLLFLQSAYPYILLPPTEIGLELCH